MSTGFLWSSWEAHWFFPLSLSDNPLPLPPLSPPQSSSLLSHVRDFRGFSSFPGKSEYTLRRARCSTPALPLGPLPWMHMAVGGREGGRRGTAEKTQEEGVLGFMLALSMPLACWWSRPCHPGWSQRGQPLLAQGHSAGELILVLLLG